MEMEIEKKREELKIEIEKEKIEIEKKRFEIEIEIEKEETSYQLIVDAMDRASEMIIQFKDNEALMKIWMEKYDNYEKLFLKNQTTTSNAIEKENVLIQDETTTNKRKRQHDQIQAPTTNVIATTTSNSNKKICN